MQSSATAELIPGVDRQLESAFAGGSVALGCTKDNTREAHL